MMEHNGDMMGFAAVILGLLTGIDLVAYVARRRMWWPLPFVIGFCDMLVAVAGTLFLYFLARELGNPLFEYRWGFPDVRSLSGLLLAEVVFTTPLFVFCVSRLARWRRWA